MTLNRAQRIIVRIGGCVLLFKLLFPPWITVSGEPFGVYFIFTPPIETIGNQVYPVRVDTLPLFLQIAAIVTGTALLVWWFDSHQAITQSPAEKTSEWSIMQKAWNTSFKLPRFEADQWLGGRRRFLWLVALCLVLLALFRAIYSKSSIMRDPLEGATAAESNPPRWEDLQPLPDTNPGNEPPPIVSP